MISASLALFGIGMVLFLGYSWIEIIAPDAKFAAVSDTKGGDDKIRMGVRFGIAAMAAGGLWHLHCLVSSC